MADDQVQYLTDAELADMRRGARRLAPGIWVDRNGFVHFSIPELLAVFGWPDDEQHRVMAEEAIRSVCAEQCPGMPIVKAEPMPNQRPQ